MAKYINNKIKSGRVAGSVFAVRYGEVIERAYNPYVTNPKTEGQIESRAKMKLLSQVAAVVAPVLAMPREGAVSPRNKFVSVNYGLVSYNNLQADLQVNRIRLTNGVMGIPALIAARTEAGLTVRLAGSAGVGIDNMTYALFIKGSDGYLRYAGSQLISEPGVSNTFDAVFSIVNPNDSFTILGYGTRFNNDTARTKYGEMQALSSETIAKLIVDRVLTEADITVTETQGVTSNPA